jgi:bifunctional non-homologous end joining protein LigD
VNLPEKTPGRWRQGITPAAMKRCHWVEPVLVAQIKFTDDQLRQPVFLGLRTDKQAKDVVRE